MAVEHNMMVNPMRMGLRLAGSVEFAGLKAPPNYARADALLDRGREMFPHLDTSDTSQWMGHRPCLPDSLPVIDRAPGLQNAWLAFGHGHIGMCGAPTTGREIANLVAGRTPEIDVAKNADVFFYLEAYAGSERLAQRVREIDPAHPGICATHHCTISMAR